MEISLLHLVDSPAAINQLAQQSEVGVEVVRVCDVLERFLQQLGFGIADDFAQRFIYPLPTAIERDDRHADPGGFKRMAEAFLAGDQRDGAFGGDRGGAPTDRMQARYQAGEEEGRDGQTAGDPHRGSLDRDRELWSALPPELEGLTGHRDLGHALEDRKRLVARL